MVAGIDRDDLYGLLGLTESCDAADIRDAYRKLARKHHPDAGGDAQAFAAIKRAHDILLDPKRRSIFDRTGQVDETIDKHREHILKEIAEAFDRVVVSICQQNARASQQQMVELLASYVEQKQSKLGEEIQNAEITLAMMRLVDNRFVAPEGKPNLLGEIARARIEGLVATIKNMRKVDELLDDVLKEIREHGFDVEIVHTVYLNNVSATTSSTTAW